MKIIIKLLILSTVMLFTMEAFICAQAKYHNPGEINSILNTLNKSYPGLTMLETIGKTDSGKEINALTIGRGETDERPGIAIVGGIDGRYVAGREIVLVFAERLLENSGNDEISDLISRVSFYIIPDASPDASSGFFSDPQYERLVNANPTDNDRDFKNDEDPFEDLNGDGLITMIRVKDPKGDYTTDPADERLMKKSDVSKGESGNWFVYTEGIDNDKDDMFNEDSPGGVNFNNNFSFEYEEFGKKAGIHAASEKESRAVADFLYEHFNIFAVFSFGPQDNLGQAFKARRQAQPEAEESQSPWGRRRSRKITSILPEDEMYNILLSEKYHECTGYEGSPGFTREAGNFMEWAYYHYGRYSYSTPGWWFPSEKGLSKEASFLKYASENIDGNVFIDWQEIDHPDFPGKTVEAGGIKPFAMYKPPEEKLNEVIESNYLFLVEAAKLHPEIELIDLKTKELQKNLYRVSVTLHNKGLFSTASQLGERVKWVRKIKLELKSDSDFQLLSGKKIIMDERLKGDESREYNWLISGKGDFIISAGAVNCGMDEINFTIR
ncbi:MAG: M14 family metallopeptidase [Bacteroidota bacterium]|nr:M14 family metallopeptidase [Bacteroidota bacterium]